MSGLTNKKCKPCEGGVSPMSEAEINTMLASLSDWQYQNGKLTKSWVLKNHYQAISFVNAIAWISHQENHHPYITVGYKDVKVEYWTHAIDGISENDFICAAKVDQLSNH
jgi:4a-hydroxytetrahydrobiopterin dehydratase